MARRIRDHNWASTSLGPVGAWSERLRLTVEQALANPCISTLVCGDDLLLLYNDPAARLYGPHHPAALGRPLPQTFPQGWATVAPFYRRAFAGESVWLGAQPLDTRGEGNPAADVFDATLLPVREADGRVAYVHMFGVETGGRTRAEAALRESEVRHRLLVESWAQAVWEADADGVVAADSPSWRAYTGQTTEQWLGYGWLDAIHPDDRSHAERRWREGIAVRGLVDAEFRLRAPDGGWRWTNVRAAPVLNATGHVEKWVGMNIDVDARKRAEAVRRESEELRRIALDGGGMGAWRWDLRERLVWGDARFLNLWGLPPSDAALPLTLFTERMSPAGAAEMWALIARAVEVGEEFDGQLEIVSGTTAGHWVRWRGRADSQEPWILHGVSFDVTDQRSAAVALRASEEQFRAFAENSADTIWIADPGRESLEYLSPAFERMFGVPRDAVMTDVRRWRDLVHPDDHGAATDFIRQAIAGETTVVHYRTVHPVDGRTVHLRDTCFPIRDGAGAVTRIAGIVQDVSDVAATTEALQAEKERFRVVVEGVPQMTWRSLDRGRWTWASPQWQAYTGQDQRESRGLGWLDALHPDDREHALSAWAGARPQGHMDVEYRVRRASDGAWRWHQTRSLPVRAVPRAGQEEGNILEWLGTSTDIDDLKRLQAEQAVLLAELQHRTRNLLAVVRSIAGRSFGPSPERDTYDQRLAAIGRVQGFLARGGGWSVSLKELVRAELMAAGSGGFDCLTVEGPAVELPGDKAQVVALALHELATNAAKYGALTQDKARLGVTWHVEDDGTSEDRLVLEWRESGVTMPPGPPTHRGFGSELIERALPYQLGAATRREFASDGLRCTIALPVGTFRAGGGAA